MMDGVPVTMNANVAIRSASSLPMSVFNRIDLTRLDTYNLTDAVTDLDVNGMWRVRYEDKPTADEVKRNAIAAELTRRGVAVSRVSL